MKKFSLNLLAALSLTGIFVVGCGLGYLVSRPEKPGFKNYEDAGMGDYEDAGIGILFKAQISNEEGPLEKAWVFKMYSGGPAEKAGIQINDEILALNGTPITEFRTMDEMAAVLIDPKNMQIQVTLSRPGKVLTLNIQKARFACMYQEAEEIRSKNKRFFTSIDIDGNRWACSCTNITEGSNIQ